MKQFKITKSPEVKDSKIVDIYNLSIVRTTGGATFYETIATAGNIKVLEDYAKVYLEWTRADGIKYIVKEFDL